MNLPARASSTLRLKGVLCVPLSKKRIRILAFALLAAASLAGGAGPARAAEDEGLTSEKAAEKVFDSVKAFVGDTTAMEKMSSAQKLDFVLTTAEDRIKQATADHFESELKSELEDYAKKSLRAKAFLDDAVPLIRKAAMSGKPFDWSLIDANMQSKVDTQMAALTASISAAKTGWEVYQSFLSGGTRAGLESLGKAVSMSLVEAYVPGWGQMKVAAELVLALCDYILAYASDTARAGMIADMYPEIKEDPGGFAKWILDKSPSELAEDVARRWDDNAVEYGRLWKGKGTESGAEEMKKTIADQLLAMRSEVVLEQSRQTDLEYKLKEPLRDAQNADYKLADTTETAWTYSRAALEKVRDFRATVYGFQKQDAQQAAQKVEVGFAKAQAEPPGAGYEPLPRSSLASQLEAAFSEIKDSYAVDGYDFVKYHEALAGYADSRKAAIDSNEQQVISARNKAEEAGLKAQSALKPVEDKLTELWDQKWALATGTHDASTGAQIDAIEKAMGPLMAQRDEMRAQFDSEIAPLTQKAEAYAGLRAADLAALAVAENVVYLEVRDRNTRMSSALDRGLEEIQQRLDAAYLKNEEAVLALNALDGLNYATLSGSTLDLIKMAYAIPASWDYPGSGVAQRAAWIERERRKVREDLETLRKLEPIQAKACGENKQEVDSAREAFKALIAERFRKMSYDESNFAERWEGLYPPSIDKTPLEVYQRADPVSRNVPIRIFEKRTIVYARQAYNCSRWKNYKIPDYVAQLAELDKASQQMQPIIPADETARRLNAAMGDLIETFIKYEPAKPGYSDKDQALAMYRLQEGKAVAGLDPLKSDGYLYLQDMKKVWAENVGKIATYEKLKKAYAGTIKYQYSPEDSFGLVDRLALIGQRIQAFEDALLEITGAGSTTTTTAASTTTTTTSGVTTTTTSSTTTTTVSGAGGGVTLDFSVGWNLVGHSGSESVLVPTILGDPAVVTTVWKWIPGTGKWAFYAPSLVGHALLDYAAGKGYDVLSFINGGEGFWVNAKQPASINLPGGNAISVATLGPKLVKGWNLVALGESATPKQFCDAQTGGVTTLWAWDATNSAWYFYAPSLDTSGNIGSYVTSKGYLDFTTSGKTLGPGVGFWVNKQ